MGQGIIPKTWNNSDSGYYQMPDGTLIQWGTEDFSSGSVTITFQKKFVSIPVVNAIYTNKDAHYHPGDFGILKTYSMTVSSCSITMGGSAPSGFNMKIDWLTIQPIYRPLFFYKS